MNRKSQMRTKRKGEGDEALSTLLAISSQYNQLLQQLATNNQQQNQRSPQAYLFDTLQNVKQINSCMKQELIMYQHFTNPTLQSFVQRKKLINSSNLIGKYESLNDQIQTFKQQIAELESNNSEEKFYEALAEEESILQAQMKRLINRRIDLRNKNQMIEYQIECGQTDLNLIKAKNIEQELKLRKIQNLIKAKNEKK